jgi:two-component system, chemotaxis family, chemotaxis protein CheY
MASILIVDDSLMSRKTLKQIFVEDGRHNVVGEAMDGEQGFEQFLRLRPDVVTMDITMPKMDGIETLHKIVRHNPDANVVMISALGQASKILQALNGGAKNYVTKPFESRQVLGAVEEALLDN